MIRIALTPEEISQLETTRRSRRSQVAERCHYVLLNAQGWSVPQIAQRLERNDHTIRKWLKAYHQQGLAGLDNAPLPGRPATKGQKLTQQLDTLLAQPPCAYGYLEAGWTVDLLWDHLGQHDLHVSDSTVRRHLQSGGWVYKRFAKTMPQNAPTAAQKKRGWQRLSLPSKHSGSSGL
jgi:transposase